METRKVLPILLMIIGVLIIILVISNLNKNKGKENVQNGTNTTSEAAKNVTQEKQGEVDVTDVVITSDGTLTNVSAQVTNNDSKTYSTVDISIIFYNADKTVLSTAKGLIEKLAPGDKKGFSSSISGDFSKSSTYEVKIDKVQ